MAFRGVAHEISRFDNSFALVIFVCKATACRSLGNPDFNAEDSIIARLTVHSLRAVIVILRALTSGI